MEAAQALLGAAPPTRPRAPASGAAASSAAGGPRAPNAQEGNSTRGIEAAEEVDLKTAVKLLLAQLYKDKKGKKRADGLDSDESAEDEELGKLPGARGAAGAKLRASMQNPKMFADRVENMATALETDSVTASAAQYAAKCRWDTSAPWATW